MWVQSLSLSLSHCQDGSNISVHLCRIAFNFPRNETRQRRWGYFNLEQPTQDNDALPNNDEDDDSENEEQETDGSNIDGPDGPTERRDSTRVGPTGDRGPIDIPGESESTDNPLVVPEQANQTTTRDQTIQQFSQIFDFNQIIDSASEDDESPP